MLSSKHLGEALRATRKAQGLRQDELAAAAGVGTRFIVDLEAGKATAQIGKILQVIQTLGLEMKLGQKGRA